MLSHTGAFHAFDKDGDGIIKLNVLEVSVTQHILCVEAMVEYTRLMEASMLFTTKSLLKIVIPGVGVP